MASSDEDSDVRIIRSVPALPPENPSVKDELRQRGDYHEEHDDDEDVEHDDDEDVYEDGKEHDDDEDAYEDDIARVKDELRTRSSSIKRAEGR
jgi:hypothetical protein